MIGAGGVFPPPAGYLEAAREACRETGVLFVADEVITGFGRAGDWFASSRFGLEPDIVTCAKGITSGYLPMGGVIAAPRIAEPFYAADAGLWRHGYTYSGHATVAAAALANLDIIEREGLLERALKLEGPLLEALQPLAEHDLVEEVRGGVGMLAAVNLRRDLVAEDPGLPTRVGMACRRGRHARAPAGRRRHRGLAAARDRRRGDRRDRGRRSGRGSTPRPDDAQPGLREPALRAAPSGTRASVERVAAGAAALGGRVVDREAGLLEESTKSIVACGR